MRLCWHYCLPGTRPLAHPSLPDLAASDPRWTTAPSTPFGVEVMPTPFSAYPWIATKTLIEAFKKAINVLTVQDKGDAQIRDTIKLRQTRPFVTKDQGYLVPKKCVFNRIVGDSQFELEFASFLENCDDVVSYAKNYMAVHFKLDYVNADGNISNYYPDFLVKLSASRIIVAETKGLADLDVPLKMQRLRQWCDDVNRAQTEVQYDFVYVDQERFDKYGPETFQQLLDGFREYK